MQPCKRLREAITTCPSSPSKHASEIKKNVQAACDKPAGSKITAYVYNLTGIRIYSPSN